jgi:hypothetical protein
VAATGRASPRPEAQAGDGPLLLWLLAVVSTLAAILSRALEPALLGVWERSDHVIHAVRLGAAGGSQLAAVGSSACVIGLVLTAVKSPLPSYLRAFGVGVGMLTLLALALSAVAVPLPESSRLVVAASSSLLALLALRTPVRLHALRAGALVLGAAAASGVLRIGTIALMSYPPDSPAEAWGVAARLLATLGWVVDVAAVLLAAAVVCTAPRRGLAGSRKTRVRWAAVAAVVLVPLLVIAGANAGTEPERSGLPVLLGNIVRLLQILPEPYVPGVARAALETMRWVTAVANLVVVPRSRMLAASLTLALCSAGTTEVPLCAAALVVSALALALHPSIPLGPDGTPAA